MLKTKIQAFTFLCSMSMSVQLHAERMLCLCCDDAELIEFTVKSCHPTASGTVVEGIDYKGLNDLVVVGTMTASVPFSHGMHGIEVEYEEYKTELSIEHTFVYEERNKSTCEDFKPKQTKIMKYQELDCVLINDTSFNDDPACYFGGHKISDLPFKIAQAVKVHMPTRN